MTPMRGGVFAQKVGHHYDEQRRLVPNVVLPPMVQPKVLQKVTVLMKDKDRKDRKKDRKDSFR